MNISVQMYFRSLYGETPCKRCDSHNILKGPLLPTVPQKQGAARSFITVFCLVKLESGIREQYRQIHYSVEIKHAA